VFNLIRLLSGENQLALAGLVGFHESGSKHRPLIQVEMPAEIYKEVLYALHRIS
jgi:hypothetical protein